MNPSEEQPLQKLHIPTEEDLRLQKLQAEIAKINAEKEVITRPEWKKISAYAVLVPAFIALAGLYLLHNSRWFEVQNEKLELRSKYLSETNALLSKEQDRLTKGIEDLAVQRAAYDKRIGELESERSLLSNVVAQLEKSLADTAGEHSQVSSNLAVALARAKRESWHMHTELVGITPLPQAPDSAMMSKFLRLGIQSVSLRWRASRHAEIDSEAEWITARLVEVTNEMRILQGLPPIGPEWQLSASTNKLLK